MGIVSVRWFALLVCVPLLASTGAPSAISAQGTSRLDPREETRLLRSAGNLEARGNFAGAEEVLRSILKQNPGSSAALFSLERVLRSQGRLEAVLPVVDTVLTSAPELARARQLRLRVMVEVEAYDDLRVAAEDWIAASPNSPEAYREIGRVFEEVFGPGESLEVLFRGREALGREDALALEIGDALAADGRPDEAVREWGMAIGEGAQNLSAVLRRLTGLDGDRASLSLSLVEDLTQEPTNLRRRQGAARIAVTVGLQDAGVRIAEGLLGELPRGERRGFVAGFARWAEEGRASTAALWAYGMMRESAQDSGEARSLDQRIASMALAAGDTAGALEAQARSAGGLPWGSLERRRSLANLLDMEALTLPPEEVMEHLEAFDREFPDAPEVDRLASTLAERMLERGEVEAARAILSSSRGPETGLTRAYLLLGEGDVAGGIEGLQAAAAELAPAEATEVIYLANVLVQLGDDAGLVGAEAVTLAGQNRDAEAVTVVLERVGAHPEDQHPILLSLAAHLADRAGDAGTGADLRETIVNRFKDSPEAPGAALALARHWSTDPDRFPQAIQVLEELILSRPNSPIVPDARRELQRLKRGIG